MIRKELGLFAHKNVGFLCLCNKDGRVETYSINTLFEGHKCPRVFGNKKNAKSKWVAMQMLDKLKLNSSMTVKEVDDIRSRFATSITSATTYRAQIALAFVEGDAVKKIQC